MPTKQQHGKNSYPDPATFAEGFKFATHYLQYSVMASSTLAPISLKNCMIFGYFKGWTIHYTNINIFFSRIKTHHDLKNHKSQWKDASVDDAYMNAHVCCVLLSQDFNW